MAGSASEENPVAINVVAMVDIIFCLCLFFMCSLKFRPLDSKFDSWLPKTGGLEGAEPRKAFDEIRVLMAWNAGANRLERIFGQARPIPSSPEGDALLRDLIKAQHHADTTRGSPDSPVIIDAGPLVPWKHVVDVMDLARDAGVPRIELAHGTRF